MTEEEKAELAHTFLFNFAKQISGYKPGREKKNKSGMNSWLELIEPWMNDDLLKLLTSDVKNTFASAEKLLDHVYKSLQNFLLTNEKVKVFANSEFFETIESKLEISERSKEYYIQKFNSLFFSTK